MIKNSLMKLSLLVLCAVSAFSQATERVYLACSSAGIRMAEFNTETGALSDPVEAAALTRSGFLALHPHQPYLYSTCATQSEGGNGGVA